MTDQTPTPLAAANDFDEIDAAGRAAYAAYCAMEPMDPAPPDWGRLGYKVEAAVWHAVARAVISSIKAPNDQVAELRALVNELVVGIMDNGGDALIALKEACERAQSALSNQVPIPDVEAVREKDFQFDPDFMLESRMRAVLINNPSANTIPLSITEAERILAALHALAMPQGNKVSGL